MVMMMMMMMMIRERKVRSEIGGIEEGGKGRKSRKNGCRENFTCMSDI